MTRAAWESPPDSAFSGPALEQRKIAAIMFTDMVGYSALAQRDEGLALELLDEHRAFLRPAFLKHQGQEVKTIGDGFRVESGSAVAAVNCAVELQEALAEVARIIVVTIARRRCPLALAVFDPEKVRPFAATHVCGFGSNPPGSGPGFGRTTPVVGTGEPRIGS